MGTILGAESVAENPQSHRAYGGRWKNKLRLFKMYSVPCSDKL